MPNIDKKRAISVDARDERDVLIMSDKEDRFVLSCAQTVHAVKQGLSVEVLRDELARLVEYLDGKLAAHADHVHTWYMMPLQGEIVFFVPSLAGYDYELASILSDLDIEIAEKFQTVPTRIQQIPGENISAFVSDKALKVTLDASTKKLHREVGAQ